MKNKNNNKENSRFNNLNIIPPNIIYNCLII